MEVQNIASWIPVSDENIVDFAIGDGPFIAEARTRLAKVEAERKRAWRALPWYVRLNRTLRYWRWNQTDRFMGWLHSRLFPDHEE